MTKGGYTQLIAYQKGYELVKEVYRLTKQFPKAEMFGLVTQLRRCAVSIPSNIAEGYMRGTREYVQFLKIALGSSAELETQLSLSRDVGYVLQGESEGVLSLNDEVKRLLISYLKRLNPV